MVLTALAVMLAATLAQHLGLSEAVAGVLVKIAKCPKCMSFWCTLAVLLYAGCDVFTALGLSLITAYVSQWLGLVLYALNIMYNRIWERIHRRK